MKADVITNIDKTEPKLEEGSGIMKQKNMEEFTLASALGAAMLGDSDDGKDQDFSFGNYGGYDSDYNDSMKDFTACSASDCGYCGHCDY